MEETNQQPDIQDDTETEFEMQPEEQTVAVAQNPAMNGNHVAAARSRPGQMPYIPPGAKISFPMPETTASLMNRVNNRSPYAPPKEKEKGDREFLDTFNLKPEAEDYQLACTRTQPSVNADGEPVPTGFNSKIQIPVMNYDEIQQRITDEWGGGVYRVTFVDLAGHRAENIQRAIRIEIPTNQHPPKREQREKIENSRSVVATPVAPGVSEEDRLFKEEMDEEKREARRHVLEKQRMEREVSKLRREKELAQLKADILTPKKEDKSIELVLLEKRLEEEKHAREEAARKAEKDREDRDRKYEKDKEDAQRRYDKDREDAQRRADDDRKMFMDGLTKVTEKLTEVANRPAPPPPPPDNSLATMVTAMVPVFAALVSRPTPPPPDHTPLILEMNKVQAESQRSNMQLVTAVMQKPPDDGSAKMIDNWMKISAKDNSKYDGMIEKLLGTLLSKDKGQALTPEVLFALQDKMEQRIERMMSLGQAAVGPNAEGGETEYDPALGFLGNAGKALFGSLKALMDSAATNPQLLELAAKLIGSRNPTDQQLAQVAWQMERGGMPPALMQPQQQYQLPGYQPTHQQAIAPSPPIYPNPLQPQQGGQQTGQTMQSRSMPPPLTQQPGQPPTQAQPSVASELEGGASGLPSNGDPEQSAPMSPEELAEQGLRDAVTNTIEVVISEAINKPAVRTWPEDARDHWPQHFIQQIIACNDNRMRLQMIGSKCETEVANKLGVIWNNGMDGVNERNNFTSEMARFVNMCKPQPAVPLPPVVMTHVTPPVVPPAPPMQPPSVPVVQG